MHVYTDKWIYNGISDQNPHILFPMNMLIHVYIFIYTDASNEDLMCAHQNILNRPLKNIPHMHISTCRDNYASMGWVIVVHIPTTHPNVTIHIMYEWSANIHFPLSPPIPILNDNGVLHASV